MPEERKKDTHKPDADVPREPFEKVCSEHATEEDVDMVHADELEPVRERRGDGREIELAQNVGHIE